MKFKPLPRRFYQPAPDVVAPLLLGHYLVRRTPAGVCGGVIVETEAYLTGDPASHAFKGERPRNRAMWGEPGHAYVYLIYGYHYCFNAVCRPQGIAEAVLVRALEPEFGIEIMQGHRPVTRERDLTNGPAKLCAAMKIDLALDALDICSADSPFFIARNAQREFFVRQNSPLITTTRIGLTKAADRPLRFYLAGSECVSVRAKFSHDSDSKKSLESP